MFCCLHKAKKKGYELMKMHAIANDIKKHQHQQTNSIYCKYV